MISESVSQYDIVLGIIVCPCEVEGYFRQTGGEETPDGAWSRQIADWVRLMEPVALRAQILVSVILYPDFKILAKSRWFTHSYARRFSVTSHK